MSVVQVYHNISADETGRPLGYLDGYLPGDPVVLVFATDAEGGTALGHCEAMFRLLNVGDDPAFGPPDPRAREYRARGNRSLSTGDLVAVDGHFYACANVGFVPVDRPAVVVQVRYGTTPLVGAERAAARS